MIPEKYHDKFLGVSLVIIGTLIMLFPPYGALIGLIIIFYGFNIYYKIRLKDEVNSVLKKKQISCPKCKTRNNPENRYCAKCGGELVRTCGGCKGKISLSEIHCGHCGGGA